jgi:bacteriocin-like protein
MSQRKSKSAKDISELSIAELSKVSGGRMEAQLNARSVNPIVISRDRALNS